MLELFKLLGIVTIQNKDAIAALNDTSEEAERSEPRISNALNKIGDVAMKIGKVVAVGMGAAATGIAAITKSSVQEFAEYEQLVGGVDTLFKDSSGKVQEYAQQAYETAGLSANQYMETITGFSASLLQSLDGDTQKAAEKGNQAIIDMSDNANKMGTSMESIQNAYQGFAKQNYTMLDNLKLGYGGTKEEMQRLLDDAEKLSGQKFDISSYADIVDAIHVVQEEMGITGTTAKEASETIQGSTSSMKSAWGNLKTAFATEGADIGAYVTKFVSSIGNVVKNVVPVVKRAIPAVVQGMRQIIGSVTEFLPGIIGELLPAIVEGATLLMDGVVEILPTFIDLIVQSLPMFIEGVIQIMNGIIEALPMIIQMICEALPTILPLLIEGAAQLMIGLVQALPTIISVLIDSLPAIVGSIIQGLWNAFPLVLGAIDDMLGGIGSAIWGVLTGFAESIGNFFQGIWEGIMNVFSGVGEFFAGVWDGITGAFGAVAEWFENIFSNAWEAVKNVFCTGGEIFAGIVDGISNVFKTVVNGIIGGINKVISVPFNAINAMLRKIKGVNILGLKPFDWINEFNVPQIPQLEKGAVLEKGQVGLLEGNGAEAVVPLERNQKWISRVADDMESQGIGGGDSEKIISAINDGFDRLISAILSMDSSMGDKMKDAIEGTSFQVNNREFARLVKAVN